MKKIRQKKNTQAGFTLIELMVVIIILGVLAGLIIPRVMGRPDEARQAKAPTAGNLPKNWRQGGYLEKDKVPKDPWGNEFVYVSPGSHGDFDLSCLGKDGEPGGEGVDKDINNWELE